jgi:hypothetical protein
MTGILLTPFSDIKPGNALMYYPEANVLVPRTTDPQSKTPAFKNILVTLVAASADGEHGLTNIELNSDVRQGVLNRDAGDHSSATAAADYNTRGSMRAC